MKTLTIQPLTLEAFQPYGTFASLTPPTSTPLVGDDVISFWPDCGGILNLGPMASNQLSIGICQVKARAMQVDVAEFHSSTSEGILPLNGDIYIHVAPPTANDVVPVDALEIFLVPKGTMVILKPGVWHHAPFVTNASETVDTLILLPPRTYANDCEVRTPDVAVPFSK